MSPQGVLCDESATFSSTGVQKGDAESGGDAPLRRHANGDVVLRHRRAAAGRVAGRHRAQELVAAAVVVVVLEKHDDERLLRLSVMEHDQLLCRQALGWAAALHL